MIRPVKWSQSLGKVVTFTDLGGALHFEEGGLLLNYRDVHGDAVFELLVSEERTLLV
jgi:hypothetical protein